MRTIAFTFLPLVALYCFAQTNEEPKDRLDELPQPWKQPIHRITFEEYDATLKYWSEQHPGLFSFEKRGQSHDGQPVYLVKITDKSVPDDDKQVALVSALHGGPERSGTTTILHLIEWMLSDDALAKEIRSKQIVLLVPIANPYAFFNTDRFTNKEKIDLYDPQLSYWDLPKLKLKVPERTPELAAFLSIVDEYKPEMHLDLHGTGLQAFPDEKMGDRTMKQGQTMFEVSACSYSNCGVRPWDPRVTEAMVKAGIEVGYGSDRAEADAQRCFFNPDHEFFRARLWNQPRPDRFRTMFYSYMKYHTMISTTEIGWEESGVARVRGILALGNQSWVDERVSGYPVSRVRFRAGRFLTTYGETAMQRRLSRAELFPKQVNFADGMLYPEFEGRATYICAVTPKGMEVLDDDPLRFVEKLRSLPDVNADVIEKFIKLGPEHRQSASSRPLEKATPIQKGLGIRLRLPHRDPEMLHLALNGHALNPSSTDGYEAWYADGFTQVQIHIPPEKTKKLDLYVITCAYKPKEKRTYGWEPPPAVKEKLKGK
jgi:hypothetical protein